MAKKLASATAIAVVVAAFFAADTSHAAEFKVLASGGFRAAYLALLPGFENVTGHKAITTWGASIGNSPNSIPARLQRGEVADVVILTGDSIDQLTKQGKVIAGSRVDLANSTIGVAVRAGTPKPDINSIDALKRAVLNAKSIAYSSSASGVYLRGLFERLGIASQIIAREVSEEPVAAVVARGEAALGFQQISELLPVSGIDFVGPLPAEIQEVTVFSAGIAATAKELGAAKALIKFLSAPESAPVIKRTGMDPR
jgi:molybdate transport system substrate-binding protein